MIAPSFGDIFASNAVKNGLLPAARRRSEEAADALIAALRSQAERRPFAVDLRGADDYRGNLTIAFEIDPVWKTQLLNGWDDIDLTLNEAPAIAAFRERDEKARPWARPQRVA